MAPKRSKESELVTARGGVLNSFNRNKTYVLKNHASMTAAELEARLSLVESNFTQFCTIQARIEQDSDDSIEHNARSEVEELYCEIKAKLLSCIGKKGRRQSNADTLNSTLLPRSTKLPTITIPQFSGKLTEWTSWFNAFETLIDKDAELDDLSKMIHLRASLSVGPLSTIECLELSGKNYEKALLLLKDRYNNKAIILQAHVKELFNLKRIKQADSDSLRSLVDKVNSQLVALKSLSEDEDLLNLFIFHLIQGKLDDDTVERWDTEWDCQKMPSWPLLSQFLVQRGINLANREVRHPKGTRTNNKNESNRASLAATVGSNNNKSNTCYCCSGTHYIKACPKFKELSPVQRYQEAKKHGLCLMCFSKRHTTKGCSGSRCDHCNKPHHKLLHMGNISKKGPQSSSKEAAPKVMREADSSSLHSTLLTRSSTNFLATAVVLIQDSNGNYHSCRCVLDSGSQLNFLTHSLVSRLRLKMQDTCIRLSGIGNATSNILGEVRTTFKSRVTRFEASAEFCVLPEITQYSPRSCSSSTWAPPHKLKLADPTFDSAENIDMLIGVSLFFNLMVAGQIKLGDNLPILQKSVLGWVVVGECSPTASISLLVQEKVQNTSPCDELLEVVQRFWKCEEVVQPERTLTDEEKQCEANFIENVRQDPCGRFIVSLPFKNPKPELGDSYQIALTRFLNLEKRLNRNNALKEQYAQFIKEYGDLGHLETVEGAHETDVRYCMPHHPVIRPESLTTSLRVVFDASCKTKNGVSLNETMLVGATLQPELFEILVRFRFYKYALTADIAKMYRQILVEDSQRNYQCILWRDNSSEPIQFLRLKTVTYGTSSAPFLAVRCLFYLAERYGERYPLAAEAVRRSFYVDDMLGGADSRSQLLKLWEEVTDLLALGKFELHKWRSNCKEAFSKAASKEPWVLQSEDAAKTLGISWICKEDTFQFSFHNRVSPIITKRAILSELAQLFDPLGVLSPIIVLGKIFMQELWLLKLQWDEELPQSYATQWLKFREELQLITLCVLPRSVVNDVAEVDSLELFGFSDASNRAYGAAIYARVIDKAGKISVHLVTAKSKVAPVRATSLPRLELQGALLMTKLMQRVLSCIHLKVAHVRYFTDSTIVLNWLSSHASRWTTFVANRVAQIQEMSQINEWFKVESKSNPADIVSRGLYPRDLKDSSLWWHGPEFLSNSEDGWQKCLWSGAKEEIPEQRKETFSLAACQPKEVADEVGNCKFANDFLKLQRVFSYVYRWRKSISGSITKGELTVAEMSGGLRYIVYNLQHLALEKEFSSLQSEKIIKSAKIQRLNPFIQVEEGIPQIRVGGRLTKADVPFELKHPILLIGNHVVVNALMDYIHRKNLHAGVHSLCAFVRQEYWVINCKKLAQKTVRSCITCFGLRPIRASQAMAPLPASRVSGNCHPFQRAGMDFAGPLWMHFNVRGKRPVKVYLCVFVCFLTKACHLEIVSDLSTNAFIAALKRFFGRRGLSTDLYCDNGTNFVGASRELNRQFDRSYQRPILDACSQRGVNFHFIPPGSPHFGGLWESAVKVAKQLLVKCANSTALNYEDLATAVAQVEAIMNSRPLHPLSSDANDYEALTPGHFLVGRPLNALVEPYDEEVLKISMTNHWKRILVVQNAFWKRWSSEYLTLLQERTKWIVASKNVKLGTLALIAEDNVPPGQWLLGRVHELHTGTDGVVRVVTLKTKTGFLKRNVHKICPLPFEE